MGFPEVMPHLHSYQMDLLGIDGIANNRTNFTDGTPITGVLDIRWSRHIVGLCYSFHYNDGGIVKS